MRERGAETVHPRCSFASTMAWVVCSSTPACCNADSSCASEMNSPPRQTHVRLRHDLVRHGRVLLDPGQEGGRQRCDQDRARQGGAERRAELARRVLQAADLGALAVGHRGDGDAPEL